MPVEVSREIAIVDAGALAAGSAASRRTSVLQLADKVTTLKDGAAMAAEAIDSGEALARITALAEMTAGH